MKRICKADGCLTILSRFNLGDKCALHEGRMTKAEMHKVMFLATEHKNDFQPKPSPRPVYRDYCMIAETVVNNTLEGI